MLRSRTLQIAVNVCLTASLLTPVQARTGPHLKPCDVVASGASLCAGCGHCHVEHRGEYCGCCKNASPARSAASHCCVKSSGNAKLSSGERQPAKHGSKRKTERRNTRASLGVCLCSSPADPKSPATPQPPIERLLQQIIAGDFVATNDAATDDRLLFTASLQGSGFALSTSRDSQRRLCIWRI